MTLRRCQHVKPSGEPCRAAPMADASFCFWHSPDHAAEVAEAGRLGGLRRKRERTVAGAYALEGISSVADIRRVVEIALLDTLGLDNSLGRNRTLAYLAMVALKLVEVGSLEERLNTLEEAVTARQALPAPLFAAYGAGAADDLAAPIHLVPADAAGTPEEEP